MFVDRAQSGPLSSFLSLFFFFLLFLPLSLPFHRISFNVSLSRASSIHGSHGVDTQGDNINIMSRSCARQWRASFSPQDAVVRGGDEVGKVSTLLPSPLSFIHPRIRGTTIFMGHMKNEVSIYRPFSPALFFLLDACRGENRRRSASQYFGILCSECS